MSNVTSLNTQKDVSYNPVEWANKKSLPESAIILKAKGQTPNHNSLIQAILADKPTITTGCAGTGKTFTTFNLGLQALARNEYRKIVLFRNTISVRDDGFLPGTEKEKNAPYEEPYKLIVQETFNKNNPEDYYELIKKNLFEFKSTRFNQGITLHDAFIIVDEAQNLNYDELYNIFTRLGQGCTIHFCGDYKKQIFLKKEQSGFEKFINVIKSSERLNEFFHFTEMTPDDIMRSDMVRDFIIADHEYDFNQQKQKK